MQYMGLNEIREKFLSFFESKGHTRLPSFPLVPQNDNSLLLINSGMAPLKPYFTGEMIPPNVRVTTCQKCIRTPDIERVGRTARHGTFFEMLGNFSFGDYFKREATQWAWEFVTKVMEIPVDRLWVSVYENDDEAVDIWVNEVGVSPDRIVRLGKEDNFWEIGSGPCGPCSEIYFDRGEEYGCGRPECAVGCDCDRYVEFWNLVFTQFDNDGHDNYTPLEKKNIDTGMGLERLACIMQGVDSLFDVDTVRNITNHVSRIAGVTYGESHETDVSLRVITDHIRSTTMMVSDGVIPSNEGRGYVLRRLLRRAARHGKLLGIDHPFLFEVCDTVIQESGQAYPDLVEKQQYIKKVIRVEEERFDATIDAGLKILEDMMAKTRQAGQTQLSGADAFKLYDTFGFPIDLTLEILEENHLSTDLDAFQQLMEQSKERSRAIQKMEGAGWESEDLGLDKSVTTKFRGYETLEVVTRPYAIICGGQVCDAAGAGEDVLVILEETPFYGESGGQVGDTGVLTTEDGCVVQVRDTQKTPDGKFVHSGHVVSGVLQKDARITAKVDAPRRQAIRRAHTSTHLLQKALKMVLGDHVEQAGSLVEPDSLRFDFVHFSAMTEEEMRKVEDIVNDTILSALPVQVQEMPIDEAKKLGAMHLFNEKYGDIVRVVQAGDFSIEFCGGTHLDNTAQAGSFKIVSESSVAAGVRRIEAVTGKGLLELFRQRQQTIADTAKALKTTPVELVGRAGQVMEEIRQGKRALESLSAKLAQKELGDLLDGSQVVKDGVRVVAKKLQDISLDTMRTMGDSIKDQAPDTVAVLAAVAGGKIQLLCVCGKQAVAQGAHAGNLIREVAKLTGGGGGGRPDSATAGGKDPAKLDSALAQVPELLKTML